MKKIKVLIIEDNKLLRDGIKAMLRQQEDIQVVAALGENVQVMDKIHDFRPDVLLLDIGLPNYNILKLVMALKKKFPWTKVIIMGLVPVQAEINQYVNAGATGFIFKDAAVDQFLKTIRTVAAGEKALPQITDSSLFSKIVDDEVKELRASKLVKSLNMTAQEKEIILMVADGMPDKEIALKLKLSDDSVKSHIHNILEKMALNTRVQITIYLNSEDD